MESFSYDCWASTWCWRQGNFRFFFFYFHHPPQQSAVIICTNSTHCLAILKTKFNGTSTSSYDTKDSFNSVDIFSQPFWIFQSHSMAHERRERTRFSIYHYLKGVECRANLMNSSINDFDFFSISSSAVVVLSLLFHCVIKFNRWNHKDDRNPIYRSIKCPRVAHSESS